MRIATKLFGALIALPAVFFAAGAAAQSFPTKPVTFVVTWPAGGTTDVIARLLAEPMAAALGQPVAVVNNVGGGGSLGTNAVLDAPRDGHTVLVTTSGNHILTPLKNDVGYRFDDFVAIGQIASRTLALAVNAKSDITSLDDLVAVAAADPGGLTYASVPNVLPDLTFRDFMRKAGVALTLLPQQGDAPGVIALLAGDIDVWIGSLSSIKSNLEAGAIRGLAVFNEARDPSAPDLPTAKEQGFDTVANPFTGLAVAKGVPNDAIAVLREALETVLMDPAFQATAAKAGTALSYIDGDGFAAVWARDWAAFKPSLQGG